jgi:hypothetical protein
MKQAEDSSRNGVVGSKGRKTPRIPRPSDRPPAINKKYLIKSPCLESYSTGKSFKIYLLNAIFGKILKIFSFFVDKNKKKV